MIQTEDQVAEPAAGPIVPRRILIISATMGEGHNATGHALQEAAGRLWPDVKTDWLDTLDVMGPGIGPLFRHIYAGNVEHTPWLYQFFYDSLCNRPWFAHASKRFVGAWAGRRLNGHLRALRPDVILSTYPLGTAALEWLRLHRGLEVPTAAWVSDFAPHPFWVYGGVDLNLVVHEQAKPFAHRLVPDAEVAVSGLPVSGAFVPQDRGMARRRLDLPGGAFVALLSCGSLGFGHIGAAADAILRAGPDVVALVACGRNDDMRRHLLAGGDREGRLRVLGWVDDIPELLAASDVVVTNAGGATALEAFACARAVLMYRPIAAHGRANARLMAEAGMTVICDDEDALTATVRRLLAQPERLAQRERDLLRQAHRRSLTDGLRRLVDRRRSRRRTRGR